LDRHGYLSFGNRNVGAEGCRVYTHGRKKMSKEDNNEVSGAKQNPNEEPRSPSEKQPAHFTN
jgi:hypothetical protein